MCSCRADEKQILRGWNSGEGGLAFIGVLIGFLSAVCMIPGFIDDKKLTKIPNSLELSSSSRTPNIYASPASMMALRHQKRGYLLL
jgi:hypothetical protein